MKRRFGENYGNICGAASIFSRRDGSFVVRIRIVWVRGSKGSHIGASETVTEKMAAMYAHAQPGCGRSIDRKIGVVEGGIIKAAAIQPRVAV